MSTPTDDRLPAGLVPAMLADVAPVEVSSQTNARLKARVMARINGPQPPPPGDARPGFIDVLATSSWQQLAPGVAIKILFEDTTSRSWMVRLQAGAALPAHEHDEGLEECLVLEGDVWLGDRQYGAGDYQLAERGTRHAVVRSDGGCVMFVRSVFAPERSA